MEAERASSLVWMKKDFVAIGGSCRQVQMTQNTLYSTLMIPQN
jgi:hypothetical protein